MVRTSNVRTHPPPSSKNDAPKRLLMSKVINIMAVMVVCWMVLTYWSILRLYPDFDDSMWKIPSPPVPPSKTSSNNKTNTTTPRPILTAYLEPLHLDQWSIKPLPERRTQASDLQVVPFPKLSSCRHLTAQWPVDDWPEQDSFLPWIHDVFPSHDGSVLVFVAQNRRRCQTGKLMAKVKEHMQPQASLFQHVPVKRVSDNSTTTTTTTRYRLSSHEDADVDGTETRFICRFKPSGQETLSVFPLNYDYHTVRKGYRKTFTEEGFDNHMIWTSQLIFHCPVPPNLQKAVSDGSTVIHDYATLFVDLVPIRTPPRYGQGTEFLPPRYQRPNTFDADQEWGDHHVLPTIENSGRWENIPICKPSLQTYDLVPKNNNNDNDDPPPLVPDTAHLIPPYRTTPTAPKIHKLIACTWASTTFQTRGGRTTVADGEHRLQEWLAFHLMAGFDHVYVYDNSGAFADDASLKSVTNRFPGRVTRVDWPASVCNNNKGNADNKGERSSQYAAESSCRLRFGSHSVWLGNMDTDEYLVPQGKYDDIKNLLDDLDREEKIKIISFHSLRSGLRFARVVKPFPTRNDNTPYIDHSTTPFLEAYNCERELPPKTSFIPAEKQIYQPDYVLLHFVHYSTITVLSQMSQTELERLDGGTKTYEWRHRYKEPHGKTAGEVHDALMLHTKSVAGPDTNGYHRHCKERRKDLMDGSCKFAFPWPGNNDKNVTRTRDNEGYHYNCFINDKIENFWVPKLKAILKTL